MHFFHKFKILLVLVIVFAFFSGSYFGYLAALVDMDEIRYIEQVRALTDKERLSNQLARAKSILDARKRAYLRRSKAFINEQMSLLSETVGNVESIEALDLTSVEKNRSFIDDLDQKIPLESPAHDQLNSLQEESSDLQFFTDEVNTIELLLAREPSDEDLDMFFSGNVKRRRVSDSLRRLFQLLDKRRELSKKRDIALKKYSYWERHPRTSPSGVDISVYNKSSVSHELTPVHITQISTALSIMPQGFDRRIDRLYIVYGDPDMRRGMSGLGVVFMKGEELDFFRVLVHEFGHIYDLYRESESGPKSVFYDGEYRLYTDDPSVSYYRLSWKNNYSKFVGLPSFASSYAMSDPFEDFAETFALYLLQGDTFRKWISDDDVLNDKYDFLKSVFSDRIYRSPEVFLARPYDVTMMPTDYDSLLASGF